MRFIALAKSSRKRKTDSERESKKSVVLADEFVARFEVNPFDEDLRTEVVDENPSMSTATHAFFTFHEPLPKIQLKSKFYAKNGDEYVVQKIVGEGAFAKVFSASVTRNTDRRNSLDHTLIPMQDDVVFKVQKPACPWEVYICGEVHKRLSQSPAYCIVSCHMFSFYHLRQSLSTKVYVNFDQRSILTHVLSFVCPLHTN